MTWEHGSVTVANLGGRHHAVAGLDGPSGELDVSTTTWRHLVMSSGWPGTCGTDWRSAGTDCGDHAGCVSAVQACRTVSRLVKADGGRSRTRPQSAVSAAQPVGAGRLRGSFRSAHSSSCETGRQTIT
jgi:hypothetical protein